MAETKTPGSRFDNETNQDPSKQHYDREFNDVVKNYSDSANSSQEDAAIERLRNDEDSEGSRSADPKKSVSDLEGSPDGFYDRGKPSENRLKGFIKKTASNRRGLALLGGGTGLVALAFAGFLAFLPLKLEMLIKTATQSAAEIPEHAIEHRLEYLTKLYIAQKVVGAANNTADIDVGEGSIAAGLFNTWRAAQYEKKLGFTIESDRLRPGETSFNWRLMDLEGKPLRIDGKLVNGTSVRGPDGVTKVISELNGRKEFRTFLRAETKKATKWHQFYKRYAMRKTLMRKYGVGHWAWLPAAATEKLDSYAERRRALFREFRTRMLDVTVGRVTKKTSMYFSCLTQGKEECKKLKNDVSSNETIRAQQDSEACAGDAACEERVRQNNENLQAAADQTQSNIDATSDTSDIDLEPPDGSDSPKGLSKLVTKQMLAKVLGGIGILDTLMRIVNSIENKGLNQVQFDRASTAYIGYTAEVLAINDQMKAGSSPEGEQSTGGFNINMEQVDVIMSMLGDFGSSPVWQKEVGILSGSDISKSSFERDCGPEKEATTLPKGETLCPERQVVLEKNPFESQTWWEATANFAAGYMKSIGGIVNLANKALGGIAETLGFNALMEKIITSTGADKLIAKGMGTMLEMIFGAAINGQETDADAGDNVLGGIQSSYFALGQTGQDMGELGDGGGLGIGGAVTDKTATAALKREIAAEKADEISQKPLFARLFDANDTDSLISQMAIRAPTNMADLAAIPKMLSSSLAQIASPQLSAALPDKNAFGFDFAYSFSTAELEADPKLYTDESCEQSHDAREASYDNNDKYPILVYTKTDPCALEKVVADAGSSGLNNEPPRYFDIASMGSSGAATKGLSFTVATYNILEANHHTPTSIDIGGCETNPVPDDPTCMKTRTAAQVKVITGVPGNPQFDIFGTQETSAEQYRLLKSSLNSYDVFPTDPSGISNSEDGALAIFWNTEKFTKFDSGKAPAISNVANGPNRGKITAPWVGLRTSSGQKLYVTSIHYPVAAFSNPDLGDVETLKEASRLTLKWVQEKAGPGVPVFVVGDFNDHVPGERTTYCAYTEGGLMQNTYDTARGASPTEQCPLKPGDTRSDLGIDHVYVTPGSSLTAKNWTHLPNYKEASDAQKKANPLVYSASDHSPMYVTMTFPGAATGDKFRIGSYNIKTSSQTDGPGHEMTPSENRTPIAANIIKSNNFDVVGLQEPSDKQIRQFNQELTGYSYWPTLSDNAPLKAGLLPIYWKSDTFTKIGDGYFGISWRDCADTSMCNRAPWVKLKHKSGMEFYVLNLHMVNVNQIIKSDDGARKREASSKEILSTIQTFPTGSKVFVLGDFNSSWGLTHDDGSLGGDRSRIPYCILTSSPLLANTYDLKIGNSGNCPTRESDPGVHYQIDHIYASKGTVISGYKQIINAQTKVASDHDPVYADVGSNEAAGGAWQWPIRKSDFTSLTGCYPTQNGTSGGNGHAGIDIDVPNVGYHQPSSPVFAAAGGVVTTVSDNIGGGISGVQIKAGKGLYTVYEHMTGYRSLVHVGQTVKAGAKIGYASDVGATGAHHLHFGITTQEGSFGSKSNPTSGTLNPLDYLPKDRSLKNALGGQCVDSKGLAI